MNVIETKVKVRDLVADYADNEEEGVVAYGGKLNIRPAYQREFVYNEDQQRAVIQSILGGFPLSILYWNSLGDDCFEVLDGQQRSLSICEFVNGGFSLNYQFFANLEDDQKDKILDYELTVYQCDGDDSEKLEWFKVINTAGEKMEPQELRNAVYHGEWLTECKRYFSKAGGPAYMVGKGYMSGSVIRQKYLEKAFKWAGDAEGLDIEGYMAKNQKEGNHEELWEYYHSIMSWAKALFPERVDGITSYSRELQKVAWGTLYNKYKDKEHDRADILRQLPDLFLDDEVTKKGGIFEYLLSGEEKYLNLRAFTPAQKEQMYNDQSGTCSETGEEFDSGICKSCGKHFDIKDMEGDHIRPWSQGGKTTLENGQMICKACNRAKGAGV